MSQDARIEVERGDGDFKRRLWTFTVQDGKPRQIDYSEWTRVRRMSAWRRSPDVVSQPAPEDVMGEARLKAGRLA